MGEPSAADLADRIESYVDMLRNQGVIRSPRVLEAFRRVHRHRLLRRFYVAKKEYSSQSGYEERINDPTDPKLEDLDMIYSHRALITRLGSNGLPTSSTSQPNLMAQMLELMNLDEGMKVLEIGAGTGYNAALISEIVGDQSLVVAVDIQPDVIADTEELLNYAGYSGIQLFALDGFFGVPEQAPFDRIVATVGLYDISPYWVEQLSDDGQMLLPLYQGGSCPLLRVTEANGRILAKAVGASGFMSIQGEMAPDTNQAVAPNTPKLRISESDWSHDSSEIEQRPGWPIGKGMQERWNLWFFITAADSRASLLPVPGRDDGDTWTTWSFGLREGNAKVIVGSGELFLVGKAEALLERLDHLRAVWEKLGRPQPGDFEIEFIPKDEFQVSEGEFAIERKYHWQVLSLGSRA